MLINMEKKTVSRDSFTVAVCLKYYVWQGGMVE